ncbi:MAG TPA: DUF4381 domain-containing protein [Gammaproteobacteria bacterium]
MNQGIDPASLPLRDIHMPDPVSWWPPAPGWWLLIAAAAAAVGYALWVRHRYRGRRVALAAVSRIAADLERGAEPVACLQTLSVVLRRFAITAARGDGGLPGLIGDRWLEYLDARSPAGGFVQGAGRRLVEAPYAPAGSVGRAEALELTRLCGDWIKTQRLGD